MNRRQFLTSTAADSRRAALGLQHCLRAGSPFRIKYYPIAPGIGLHDVAPAPDGTIWFPASAMAYWGRLDPRDGSFKTIDLGKGAAPHGVTIGPDGAPWVTEGGQNAIARVDPGDHKVTLFHLPKKHAYANLNTGVFDRTGIYWFTGQSGIYGRLEPKSGDMTVFKAPRGVGTLRHDSDHAEGRRLVRLARRQPHRQDRSRDRQRHDRRTADAQSGRTAGLVGFQRPDLGQRVEQRQRVGARSC